MRKKQKEQIMEILMTLREAHMIVKEQIKCADFQNAYCLLGECQQTAASIGGLIEKTAGEACSSIKRLEDYCESLYQISECLSGTVSPRIVCKTLDASLRLVENSINEEIAVKTEIVFLPYKASMWDSLESVWRAAEKDPNCDAYVIPIPYYDKAPDGSPKVWHYEKSQYPPYVPTVSYEEYCIEKRRPDMIFVHYPYDNSNYVTSVHPDFYCEKLKNLTELLVYVPYFVNLDNVPEHFCICAGTLYADLVAVQSERVRKTYLHQWKRFEKEHRCRNYFGNAGQKFIALGSPKMDRAISDGQKQFVLPEVWSTVCSGIDQKKIVLLNTTLTYILKYGSHYIERLREVFDIFRAYDDVLLWWRPHPLSDATFSSMRRDLHEEYRQLIEYYKNNDIGIYDDSSDLYRAVAVCDACYGDNSSVLALVWALKKPVMYRNTVKAFDTEKPEEGNFMDAVYPAKGGVKKMLLYESEKYSLRHFLYDIRNKERYNAIEHFIEEHFERTAAESYANFGHAGEAIYSMAKTYLSGED